MKIHILSDLHLNFRAFDFIDVPEARVVIVAGDADEKLAKNSLPWVAAECKRRGVDVIYVPGNHDFYTENLDLEIPKARAVAEEIGLHLLAEGESVVIDGVRFIGATLWTDYGITYDRSGAMREAGHTMNDFKYIRSGENYRRLTPQWLLEHHQRQRDRIEAALAEPFDGKTVVITHHPPHPNSLRGGRVKEQIDASYASDLSDLIAHYRPTLWVHGHVHENRDYQVEDTRIVSNPRGYVRTVGRKKDEVLDVENPAFDPQFAVTL